MSQTNGLFDILFKGLVDYETQKVVQIHSKKIGVTFRLIQLGIILYVVLWVMIYEKGYQSFDQAVSGVTAKLKGVAFANVTNNPSLGATVWDAADYVIPPQQNSAFFVMTNLIYTPGQTLGNCEESHDVFGNSCHNDSQCHSGQLVQRGSGIQTGRCVNSTRQSNLRVCEIYGWCPTEHDVIPRPHLLASAENFTVMIKNNIEFPHFRVKRRNILNWMSRLFLKTCLYNPNDDKFKYCPVFRLGDILKYSDPVNKDIWETGGMVSIHIEWNCNLDFDEEKCLPKYIFRRLDDFQSNVAKGWNFRFSQHYIDGGVRKRNLIKAYGIQFFITVYGTGGKFNILTFSMNLGSGLALLGIATMLCDLIVLNITEKRDIYRKAKIDLIAEKINIHQSSEKFNIHDNTYPVVKVTKSDKKRHLIIRRHHEFVRTPDSIRRSSFQSIKQFINERSPLSFRKLNVTPINFIPKIKSKQNHISLIQSNLLSKAQIPGENLIPINHHAQSRQNVTSINNKTDNNISNASISSNNPHSLISDLSDRTTFQKSSFSLNPPSTTFNINTTNKQQYWRQQRLLYE
uniref:ATP receptor n=1 Tax=Schistosoma mansoni TaxID=6183 RepID=A0A5K4F3P5_SCHMA